MLVLAPNQKVEKYPYSLGNLRKDRPNVSFPKNPTDDQLAAFNVFRVKPTTRPEVDHTKNVVELNPVFNGEWVQTWSTPNASAQEIAERTEQKSVQVRDERYIKLANSDWTQVADAPVNKQAWATYRQALRDIPLQAGFPWNVSWPSEP